MFISVYNLFYTALPVLGVGIFEQDVSDKHSLEYPKLYTPGLTNALFNTKEFVKSVIHGVFSSLVLFLIPYGEIFQKFFRIFQLINIFHIQGTYREAISPEGHVLSDHMLLGVVVATILILDNTVQVIISQLS
jgi:magnesium-transporting ATPase (P-type)